MNEEDERETLLIIQQSIKAAAKKYPDDSLFISTFNMNFDVEDYFLDLASEYDLLDKSRLTYNLLDVGLDKLEHDNDSKKLIQLSQAVKQVIENLKNDNSLFKLSKKIDNDGKNYLKIYQISYSDLAIEMKDFLRERI